MRINVPGELAACVKQLGGVVLDEELLRPNIPNADFWFPLDNVVAELKCLTEDLTTKAEFNRAVMALYMSWSKRGLVPPSTGQGRIRFNLHDLPQKCAREFIEPVKKRLEASTIKKANRQIRETKQYLNAPQAKGLLLLVNDGNYMLPPSMMTHLLARILKGKHSSISSVIYFSVNEKTSAEGLPHPNLFWIDALVPEREPVSPQFRRALRHAWVAHHSRLVPEAVFEIDRSAEPELVDSMQFSKKPNS